MSRPSIHGKVKRNSLQNTQLIFDKSPSQPLGPESRNAETNMFSTLRVLAGFFMSFLRFQFSTDSLSFFPCVLVASVYVSKARSRTVLLMGNVNENCRGSNVTSVSTNVTSIVVIV